MAQTVGYCYQNPDHQIFAPSVEKEIRFGPANLGLPAKQVDQRVRDAMAAVGLTSVAGANPFVLGRGRRQLLAVASILAMNPQVLVIDEPTTGLDLSGARQIMDLLARWNEDGRTIVVITHDMDLVMEYVRRCVVMAHGRVIADGPVSEVMRRPDVLGPAHLVAPPVVTVSDRLAPFGAQRRRTLTEVVADVQEHMEVRHASRLQHLPRYRLLRPQQA
jgi:energy-coupling factor transport system ATP-binding protein